MVIVRKGKQTLWEEKIGALEEALEEINKENKTVSLGSGCFGERKEGDICIEDVMINDLKTYLYKTEVRKSKIFKYCRRIIAYLRTDENNSVIFQATKQEYVPVLEKICGAYERKTLKDEPIIEY